MKKATLFKSAVLALLVCVGFAACENNSSEVLEEPETYTVKLGWAGEILDISYEPMATRAATDDLYGIQVYSKPQTAGNETYWAPYAYGLFDDPNNIIISLQNGSKYKFVATMVRDGKNRIYLYKSNTYYSPFRLNNSDGCPLTNKFDYSGSVSFYGATDMLNELKRGSTVLKPSNEFYNIPNVTRFYGELSDYTPGENSTAKINMKRTVFGAKFVASGKLAVDGKLEIQIADAPKMELALTEGDDEISDVFTFKNVYKAWENDNYTETINVSFNWNRKDGSVQPLGTHEITFKRNTITVVEVNIDKDGSDENLGVDIPDSETGDLADGDTITITDGVIQ